MPHDSKYVSVNTRSAHLSNKSWRHSFKISRLEAILTIECERDGAIKESL